MYELLRVIVLTALTFLVAGALLATLDLLMSQHRE
jgi:hypothetical protein